uniref:NADH-quinone oxidoreductase subunit E n=1 Tax=Aquifex aeolicus TaxID=63363 RepID=UPI00111C9447|nr:Chain A, NADH-quinone oxidoreductase subunit E [Aquifex aeolicus]6HLM_C Chain C, NADH-quinone oxidoreductase subunit E [Aquifex aeolicus]6Q9G_A Chain A, NADH-quinone oxidoreductase subunit E [Aquifex aeolicus VF5]6Q9G_C Chain C, NADH-quinone oxidoreductase subunit E [Aquifex aeolicus VF5]
MFKTEFEFPEELKTKLQEHINYFPKKRQAILLCLHEIQNYYGYIPPESLKPLADMLELPLNHVEGVVAFYDMFDREDKAKYRIRVCVSIVCHLMGTNKLLKALENILGIKPGEVTPDGKFKIVPVQCLDACSEAPVFMVNDDEYKFESEVQLNEILSRYT